jgi:acetyltransferase-like isoleucine patch superfamily enzyme
MTANRRLAATIMSGYVLGRRARNRAFTELVKGAFHDFGHRSSINLPMYIDRPEHISIGEHCVLGPGTSIYIIGQPRSGQAVVRIGDRVTFRRSCTISAVHSVDICSGALLAGNIYISDHSHGYRGAGHVRDQGLVAHAPVRIGDGAWIGENVVIMPGVTIGAGAVVAANAVVRSDVPDRSLATGVPARVSRSWADTPADRPATPEGN